MMSNFLPNSIHKFTEYNIHSREKESSQQVNIVGILFKFSDNVEDDLLKILTPNI